MPQSIGAQFRCGVKGFQGLGVAIRGTARNELDTALHTKDKNDPDKNKMIAERGFADVEQAEHELHVESAHQHQMRSSGTWGDRTMRHKH